MNLDAAANGRAGGLECVCVLVANGVRLSTVRDNHRRYITPAMVAFERGVLQWRAAVVVLMGIKRRRGPELWHLDTYLVSLESGE